jgi:WD40 repeat protein
MLAITSGVLGLAISHNGRYVAFSSKDGHTRIWDTQNGQCRKLPGRKRNYVYAVAYSPDMLSVVIGSRDEGAVIQRLDKSSEDVVPAGDKDRVLAVAFSPDGIAVVSGSWNQGVRMWNAATGDLLWTDKSIDKGPTHKGPVTATTFSPDGGTVASGSTDHTIRLWDTKTGKPVRRQVCSHGSDVYRVVWSPDGSRLASCSKDETVAVWDSYRRGPPIMTMRHQDIVTSVAWVPSSGDIISASASGKDRSVRRWNSATGQLLFIYAGPNSPIRAIATFPDGKTIVTGCEDGSVRMWNIHSQTVLLQYRINSEPRRISFVRKSPNGTVFAACTADGHIEVMDAKSGKHLGAFRAPSDPTALSFSEEGTVLVSSYLDGGHNDWCEGRDFVVPPSPAITPRADIRFSADAQGWIFASYRERKTPRRLFMAPKDLRWSDWSLQAASVGAVLAFGSDSGVLTVMDFTSVLTDTA